MPDDHEPRLQLCSPGPGGSPTHSHPSAALLSSVMWTLGRRVEADDRAAHRSNLKLAPAHALRPHEGPLGSRGLREAICPGLTCLSHRAAWPPSTSPCPTSPGKGQSNPIPSTVVSDSVRPHRRQPPRPPRPWDSPGKNTGVGLPFPSPIPSTGVYQIPPFVLQNLISFFGPPMVSKHFTIGTRPGSRGSRPTLRVRKRGRVQPGPQSPRFKPFLLPPPPSKRRPAHWPSRAALGPCIFSEQPSPGWPSPSQSRLDTGPQPCRRTEGRETRSDGASWAPVPF